jgi:hypothetical protein
MSKVDPGLEHAAEANPAERFRVIVRVADDLDTQQAQLESLGFTITRRLRLIQGFSASVSGATILEAAAEQWIVSIEPDTEVSALGNGTVD